MTLRQFSFPLMLRTLLAVPKQGGSSLFEMRAILSRSTAVRAWRGVGLASFSFGLLVSPAANLSR